jgi:3-dehydro-L-gulonate 2-dehydrogenase
MSQFSYGALESYRKRGEPLPVDGGFDLNGNLTRDPAAIEASWRPLPAGYWKGSGLSLVLDMIAAMLTLGQATHQLSGDPEFECGVSQMFLAIDPATLGADPQTPNPRVDEIADSIIASLHRAQPAQPGARVRYPGEETLRIRAENRRLGLPVDPALWAEIQSM